jgi:hypothetical protein
MTPTRRVRARSWLAVATMAAASALAFVLPLSAVAALAAGAVAAMRRGRRAFLAYSVATVAIYSALFGLVLQAPPLVDLGPLSWGAGGALRGLAGGLRLVAVLAANLAVLSRLPIERLLDGLGLPRRALAFLGAVLLSAHDLGRDSARLVAARRLEGRWPTSRLRKAAAAAGIVAPLAVLALRRARVRAEALRLAGHATGRSFAPLVAVTSLAVAGRLALLAVPNVSLVYVVVFCGGLLFGARVGVLAGLLSMALTDLAISGLAPQAFANAPAMALLGLLGGALRGVDFAGSRAADRWAGRMLAATAGLLATFLFSISADALTWLLVPDFRHDVGALRVLVASGLVFNVVPAVANAVLFAAAVGPVSTAAHQAGALAPPSQPSPRDASA